MKRIIKYVFLLPVFLMILSLPLSRNCMDTIPSAYAQFNTPSVRIEGILNGTVPGRYRVVSAEVIYDNRSSREIRVNAGDIVAVDWNGREYRAEIYNLGNWYPEYNPWGRPYYYPYPQAVSWIPVFPNSQAAIRVSFYLPLDTDVRTIIVRYQGSELRRAMVF